MTTTRTHAAKSDDSRPSNVDSGAVANTAANDRPLYRSPPTSRDTIVIGLDADMSSASAESGESIRRGVVIAIDEINRSGGLLGRKLELVIRDHRGNPARGIDNVDELASIENLVAIIGGIHTPVALEEIESIHRNGVVYLGPWAAGTPLVSNGRDPNYVFRVSVRDEFAGSYLVDAAIKRGTSRVGLLLERTGWGRSNERAVTKALNERGLKPSAVQWFNWGERDLTDQLNELIDQGSEVVLLVANPLEGVLAVKGMASMDRAKRLPIISHWGITGGNFFELTRESLPNIDLVFLQTYSFLSPTLPERAKPVIDAYRRLFSAESTKDIFAPAGTAHAYDAVHILAAAIDKAKSTNRSKVRTALEELELHRGLIRDYSPPFRPDHHDALTIDDFRLARYTEDGTIVLVDDQHTDEVAHE